MLRPTVQEETAGANGIVMRVDTALVLLGGPPKITGVSFPLASLPPRVVICQPLHVALWKAHSVNIAAYRLMQQVFVVNDLSDALRWIDRQAQFWEQSQREPSDSALGSLPE